MSGLLAALLLAGGVQVGLERLEAEAGGALRGRRVGLVAHAASVTAEGRHAIDVLLGSGVELVRVFAPEHGLRGRAAAGEAVADGRDPATGLPVVSLYGSRQRPALEQLRDLDALVVDLQDAGVRFYTYVSTLLLCLEAAREAGIPLVVLDRPNPLGGEMVAGPLPDPRESVPRSLVNTAPGPLIHGLTLGEMARFVAAQHGQPSAVQVVAMRGWERSMRWPDTGRSWVPPSPNLRSAEAALAYPGTCLLEATTLSEGRGSDAPFLKLGAPGLSPGALRRAVVAPGYALDPVSFVPVESPAAPSPRYAGQRVSGVEVRVTDPAQAQPWELGVRLLAALRDLGWLEWRSEEALDRLIGSRGLRLGLQSGAAPEAMLAADAVSAAAFRRERAHALLY